VSQTLANPMLEIQRLPCQALRTALALALAALAVKVDALVAPLLVLFVVFHIGGNLGVTIHSTLSQPNIARWARPAGWTLALFFGLLLNSGISRWEQSLQLAATNPGSAFRSWLLSQTTALLQICNPSPLFWILVWSIVLAGWVFRPCAPSCLWRAIPNRFFEPVAAGFSLLRETGQHVVMTLAGAAVVHLLLWAVGLRLLGFYDSTPLALLLSLLSSLGWWGWLIGFAVLTVAVCSQGLGWTAFAGISIIGAVIWFVQFLLFENSMRRVRCLRLPLHSLPLFIIGYRIDGLLGAVVLTLLFNLFFAASLPLGQFLPGFGFSAEH